MTTVLNQQENEACIAYNLGSLLRSRNLNANQLASILKIPAMTISRVLSGQTADPRIYTLKIITDYLGVSIDSLLNNTSNTSKSIKPNFVPMLDWETIQKINNINEIDLQNWRDWQPIPPSENTHKFSEELFAFTSRPSMYPRYRHGSVLIIDCLAKPVDGDVVLVKIKASNEISVRELIVDAQDWQLRPIVNGASVLYFSASEHQIIGVNQLTMLYR